MKIIYNDLEAVKLIEAFRPQLDLICSEIPIDDCIGRTCIKCLFSGFENLELERVPIYEK